MPISHLRRDSAPHRRPLAWLAPLLFATLFADASASEAKVDYNRDVRPILSENCFACHGFDDASREADLRLDVSDSATADRGGYAAIVAGDSAASEAWQRITSDDESEVMPPGDSHRELTAEQKDILRRWIDVGAVYGTN